MKRYQKPVTAAVSVLLAVTLTAVLLVSGKGTAGKKLAFLRTELVSDRPAGEPEYDDATNQTAYRLELAGGGFLGVTEKGELVEVKNFDTGGRTGVPGTLEELAAALERELDLTGYDRVEEKERDLQELQTLVWEKQEGGYRNPYDAVRVQVDRETMQLCRLRRFAFPARHTEPVLTPEEALAAAAPYFAGGKGEAVRITYARPDLNAGKGGVPKYGPNADLAYQIEGRGVNTRVCVLVDAVTGEVIGLAEAFDPDEEPPDSAPQE